MTFFCLKFTYFFFNNRKRSSLIPSKNKNDFVLIIKRNRYFYKDKKNGLRYHNIQKL